MEFIVYLNKLVASASEMCQQAIYSLGQHVGKDIK